MAKEKTQADIIEIIQKRIATIYYKIAQDTAHGHPINPHRDIDLIAQRLMRAAKMREIASELHSLEMEIRVDKEYYNEQL